MNLPQPIFLPSSTQNSEYPVRHSMHTRPFAKTITSMVIGITFTWASSIISGSARKCAVSRFRLYFVLGPCKPQVFRKPIQGMGVDIGAEFIWGQHPFSCSRN
jgi:hypothetical protein